MNTKRFINFSVNLTWVVVASNSSLKGVIIIRDQVYVLRILLYITFY
jgi:hypothetical protein